MVNNKVLIIFCAVIYSVLANISTNDIEHFLRALDDAMDGTGGGKNASQGIQQVNTTLNSLGSTPQDVNKTGGIIPGLDGIASKLVNAGVELVKKIGPSVTSSENTEANNNGTKTFTSIFSKIGNVLDNTVPKWVKKKKPTKWFESFSISSFFEHPIDGLKNITSNIKQYI